MVSGPSAGGLPSASQQAAKQHGCRILASNCIGGRAEYDVYRAACPHTCDSVNTRQHQHLPPPPVLLLTPRTTDVPDLVDNFEDAAK